MDPHGEQILRPFSQGKTLGAIERGDGRQPEETLRLMCSD